uniref:Variant surface glycoprotein 1125.2539 n=1 Tax=Trypanosoma brucei TaxID=5691 RepID=A0A1J0R8C8_9TRYP|nr:variant surface glycoprotein 1125.2539 [Trypanosoma brucei]
MSALYSPQATLKLAVCLPVTQPDAAKPTEKCTTVCECSFQLRSAVRFYHSKQAEAESKLQALAIQTLKLATAATNKDKELAAKALPALAAIGTLYDNCASLVQTGRSLLAQHVETLAATARALAMVAQLEADDGEVVLVTQTHSGKFTGASISGSSLGSKHSELCPNTNPEDAKATFDGTNTSNAISIPDLEPTTETTIACSHDGSADDNCVSTAMAAGSGKLWFTNKLTSNPRQAVAAEAAWADDTNHRKVIITHKSKILGKNISDANEANKLLREHFTSSQCADAFPTFEDFAGEARFTRQIIRTLVGDATSEETETKPESKLAAAIEVAYGKSGEKFKQNLWDKIEKLKPKINSGKSTEDLNLQTVSSLGKLTEALARQLGSSLKTHVASEEETVKQEESTDKAGEKKENGEINPQLQTAPAIPRRMLALKDRIANGKITLAKIPVSLSVINWL